MAAENADAKVHQVGVDANSVRGLRRLGLNGGQWTASGEQKKTGQQNPASQGRPTTKPDRNELLLFHDKDRSKVFFNAGPYREKLAHTSSFTSQSIRVCRARRRSAY